MKSQNRKERGKKVRKKGNMPMKNTTGTKLKHEVEQKKRSGRKLGGGSKVRA